MKVKLTAVSGFFISIFAFNLLAEVAVERSFFDRIDPLTEKKINESFLYLKANFFLHQEKPNKSLEICKRMIASEPSDQTYDVYIKALSSINKFKEVEKIMQEKGSVFEKNEEVKMLYVQALANLDKKKQAEEQIEQLRREYPEKVEIVYLHAMMEEGSDPSKAIEIIDSFVSGKNIPPKSFILFFIKAKILAKLDKNDEAIESLEKCLKLRPNFEKAILLKALMLEQKKDFDLAIKFYERFLQVSDDSTIRKHIVQLLLSKKKYKKATEHFQKLKKYENYNVDLALLELKAKNFDSALKVIELEIGKNPESIVANMLKAEVLLAEGKVLESIKILPTLLMKCPEDNDIVHSLLFVKPYEKYRKRTIVALGKVIERYPSQSNLRIARGDVNLLERNYSAATLDYKNVLNRTRNEDLVARLMFQVGFCFFKQGKNEQAKAILKEAVRAKVVYPSSYNLLAYCYTLSNSKLSESFQLVEKAIECNAQSGYFWDTKGLVLLRQEKYSRAAECFAKALEFLPEDEVVKEHLKDAESKQ